MERAVLSVSTRPKQLDDLIGQHDIVDAIKSQFDSGRIPHFYLLTGEPGVGKTTLARILAALLQVPPNSKGHFAVKIPDDVWKKYSTFDIQEINASNSTSVDNMRELLDKCRYKPRMGSRAKVYIIDEAHQLSTAAQNCMLKDTEEPPAHVFFIMLTSQGGKIIPALKRRAMVLNIEGIRPTALGELVERLQNAIEESGQERVPDYKVDKFKQVINDAGIDSAGLIVQAFERFVGSGYNDACILSGTSVDNKDGLRLARAIVSGDWNAVRQLLQDVPKADMMGYRILVLSYLKAMLLNGKMVKACYLAIDYIAAAPVDDYCLVPTTVSAFYKATVCFAKSA